MELRNKIVDENKSFTEEHARLLFLCEFHGGQRQGLVTAALKLLKAYPQDAVLHRNAPQLMLADKSAESMRMAVETIEKAASLLPNQYRVKYDVGYIAYWAWKNTGDQRYKSLSVSSFTEYKAAALRDPNADSHVIDAASSYLQELRGSS